MIHYFQTLSTYFTAELSYLKVAGSAALHPEGKNTLQLLKWLKYILNTNALQWDLGHYSLPKTPNISCNI